jgi:uncharacterized protein (DUF885 family)
LRYIIAVMLLALPPVGWKGEEKVPLPAATAEAIVDSVGREYYDAKFALYPAYATSKGAHDYDSRLSTFSPRSINAFLRRTKRFQTSLSNFDEDSLGIEAWVDLRALQADMATQQLVLEDLDLWHRSPVLYSDACIDGIYSLIVRPDRADPGAALAARLAMVPEVVASGRSNLTEPVRLHCEVASQSLKDLSHFLANFAEEDTGFDVDPRLLRRAEKSLSGFAVYLDSLGQVADPEFHLGRDGLIKLLETEHMIDDPPEALIAYAENILAEAQAGRRSFFGSASQADIDTAKANLLTAEDLKAHLHAEIESARVFIRRRDLVTLPDKESIMVAETPGFLRNLIPGYAYEPAGPLDTCRTGLFYVPLAGEMNLATRLSCARKITERGWRGVVVHEAFPGHHMQITVANEHPSYIRRLQDNLFAMEGWALYCEEMMAREGYCGDDGIGAALGGIVFRAARGIVDVQLQLGEFSLDEAVDFMVRETGAPRGFIEKEVRRCAVRPTQAMSYLIGKREMVALRDEIETIVGDSFTLKRFHDIVVSCGSLPPYLLKTCAISEAVGRP